MSSSKSAIVTDLHGVTFSFQSSSMIFPQHRFVLSRVHGTRKVNVCLFRSQLSANPPKTQPRFLRSRMKFPVNISQSVSRHVRINFRRADSRVAEQFLDY